MYRTKEIASLVRVHPNTVRVYEQWGYISPVPRLANGYRVYSDIHLFQLQIARTLFQCEIVQGDIRYRARNIVITAGREEFIAALRMTYEYLSHLESEYRHAIAAAEAVENWLHKEVPPSDKIYSRAEAALILGVTTEALRNWERNGLITIPRLENGYRRYGGKELSKLQIIRGLRSAHYSLQSILRLLCQLDRFPSDVIVTLNSPTEEEDIISVSDRLIQSLLEAIQGAKNTIILFDTYRYLYNMPH